MKNICQMIIDGRNYSYNPKAWKVKVGNRIIKLESYYEKNGNMDSGIYVCSCSPNRNPGSLSDDEPFPQACQHIINMKKDRYLEFVLKKLLKDKKFLKRYSKSDFLNVLSEALEIEEYKMASKCIAQQISKDSE